ncbi:hypothetical protein [Gemmatimonas sp.]|uniref:hypothetical protein n=1 Tax=Gemmatimonas sp. TaxID=1962908 RepID=UPI00391967EA
MIRAVTMAVWRPVLVAAIGILLVMTSAERAAAQVDPRGTVRTITTPHLYVHYPAALDSLARLAAVFGETAYGQLARELVAPRGRIDLLLTDNVDASNGFAQVFPTNRVVIYAVPPVGTRELRFHDDWLRLVITHELAHIFHIDRARGLWRAGRWLFGRNPLFFPNAFTPSWVKEGLAVHYESALTGSGRLVSTEFPVLLRAAARDSALVPYGRWSLATTRFPRGQTAYGYGSLLMQRAVDLADSVHGMRRFVEATAGDLIPFRLQRMSRAGFGERFSTLYRTLRDSAQAAASAAPADGDAVWQYVSLDGWYAQAPRWVGNDSLLWSASTGREVTGLYVAPVVGGGLPRRVAWRNGLDMNVPLDSSAQRVVFAQDERLDPYITRSDLYVRDGGVHDGRDRRLTVGQRLTMPDVRADGSIVAVQLSANGSRLVRVSGTGDAITPLTRDMVGERWAEPRWSPNGEEIAAVQLLPTGEQRVVVLTVFGDVRRVVSGGRAVFASPAFTPDGARLVWSSDRSGRMQLETAARGALGVVDTLSWRTTEVATQASAVTTGVYEPSVSPDGARVAALVQRGDGYHVAWAPLDTAGAMVRGGFYPRTNAVRIPAFADSARVSAQASTRYGVWRQLVPRYWLPLAGESRLGDITYGVSSSGVDILGRHAWSGSLLLEPTTREYDGALSYRYAGLGVPVADVSYSQEWDGTFVVRNNSGARLGTVARRRRFLTASNTYVVPRVRWNVVGTIGAQYELRAFKAAADSIRGTADDPLRTGVRYPSLFLNASVSTARRALRGVSVAEGFTLSNSVAYRWQEESAEGGSFRDIRTARAYLPLDLPGYARHVLATRVAVGYADNNTRTEFTVGGASGVTSELLPGVVVGDPLRPFPVRGTPPGVQRGARALAGSVEYRAPLLMFRRVPSPFTVYSDRLSVVLFSDAARAWCPASLRRNAVVCLPNGVRDGWLASAGGEVVLDLALQYDVPYRVRLGTAVPYVAPAGVSRKASVYVTLGGYF